LPLRHRSETAFYLVRAMDDHVALADKRAELVTVRRLLRRRQVVNALQRSL
jgi:hypothetical protein